MSLKVHCSGSLTTLRWFSKIQIREFVGKSQALNPTRTSRCCTQSCLPFLSSVSQPGGRTIKLCPACVCMCAVNCADIKAAQIRNFIYSITHRTTFYRFLMQPDSSSMLNFISSASFMNKLVCSLYWHMSMRPFEYE